MILPSVAVSDLTKAANSSGESPKIKSPKPVSRLLVGVSFKAVSAPGHHNIRHGFEWQEQAIPVARLITCIT